MTRHASDNPAPRPDSSSQRADAFDSTELLVLDVAAARELDRLATTEYGLPSLVLMENASRELAEVVFDTIAELPEPQRHAGVLIVCGPGNNGGDGRALLRHLDNADVCAIAVCVGAPRPNSDVAAQHAICTKAALCCLDAPSGDLTAAINRLCPGGNIPSIVVDCLIGTGLTRSPDAPVAAAIATINDLASKGSVVISADVPSGLDAQAGTTPGAAVRADITVTFAAIKPGLLTLEAQSCVGEIVIADIGVPRTLVERLARRICIQQRSESPQARSGDESPRRPR